MRAFQLTVTQPEIAAILSRVLWKEIQYERVGSEQCVKDIVELTVPHLVQGRFRPEQFVPGVTCQRSLEKVCSYGMFTQHL